MTDTSAILSDAQLRSEMDRCLYCEEKPCKTACPADCSPADFIMAARSGEPRDYRRSAKLILGSNPFGGVCGAVCPDWFCVKACSRRLFDAPINIPAVQAAIVRRSGELGGGKGFKVPPFNGKTVAVVGAGPAGLSAAALLAQLGYGADVYEKHASAGGACRLIPRSRLPVKALEGSVKFALSAGRVRLRAGKAVKDPAALLKKYPAVILASGCSERIRLGITNEDLGLDGLAFLAGPGRARIKGANVAVIGGGAVAADCAMTALALGARRAEILTRKDTGAIQLPAAELSALLRAGVNVNARTRITGILERGGKTAGLTSVRLDDKGRDIADSAQVRSDVDVVILAVKNLPAFGKSGARGLFHAGDSANGGSSVVESVASGKNAALQADAFLRRSGKGPDRTGEADKKSRAVLGGRSMLPVDLSSDFFGRRLRSPFLISASPHSDGYEQVKMAYEAGWPGVVMKTAFDGQHIHIPAGYMFTFSDSTYGNSDNVSGHPLDRVCREVARLVREYPDRMTAASTGGPVTGDDAKDRKAWQSNTLKLERAGAMAIEYSLSCPQGGDGTKGDIVSQDPELTAKIVNWVMEVSDPGVPKLFKLTGAVTSVYQIVNAIREVYARYPRKKAGITLANSFPALAFRKGGGKWDEGVVVGMSGEGVTPISNLTIAKASALKVPVSGNAGPMDYRAAANFLALGAGSVQFCTIVMKYGFGVIDELNWGLSHLLEERGLKSVGALIGAALPKPVTGFMELSAVKELPEADPRLCMRCGNCLRCGYLAISLDKDKVPSADPSKCIGCSLCVKKCFSGALRMRRRTGAEAGVTPD